MRAFSEEIEQGGLTWSYWDYSLRYVLAPDDHFYGMGQADQLSGPVDLDHRGKLHEVWNQHSPPAVTIFPCVLSLRGYALLVDNPCRATWDLGHSDQQSFTYRARGGGLQYYVVLGPRLPRLLHTVASPSVVLGPRLETNFTVDDSAMMIALGKMTGSLSR